MAIIAAFETDILAGRAALLGITTPLGDMISPVSTTGPVLAVVTARLGTLAADTAPGATVRGSGTAMLWISGTAAQVNAKLETLTYTGSVAGMDTLAMSYVDAAGRLATSAQESLAVVPLASGSNPDSTVVQINRGTLTLDTRLIDGPTLAWEEMAGSQTATTGILINTTIGAHSALSIHNDNAAGTVVPRLAIAGRVELDGTARLTGNGVAVLLAQGASLINEGDMTIGPQAARFSGAGALVNDGTITVNGSLGDTSGSGTVGIDVAITGSGRIALTAGVSLTLSGSVDAAEVVHLGDGGNTLHLTRPGTFAGLVTGFSHGDAIVLDGVTATSASVRVDSDSGSSTLSLFNGAAAIGAIRLGEYDAGSTFDLDTDAAGNATVRLVPVSNLAPSATTDVFRFFDAAHGTQLLTQNQAERSAILSSRPDLRFEGVAFQAVAPAAADPATAAVFRFFDTNNGTHFMTASTGERDTLISSRPDLVYEPGSTMFEHATAQQGDVAVYRFFDGRSGAHFFTADIGERASILATRPDMVLEGTAFYAPAH